MNPTKTHNTSLGKNGTDRFGFIGDGSESSTFNGSHNNYYYTGSVDEIRLWNYARSSGEIQENRGKRLTGCNAGLVLYYDFNEGGGTGFYDKATHTFARFNGAISRETAGAPLPNCASPSFESDPLLVGLSDYRYGFQGQERDDEIKGVGNSLNYKYRMHDPRIGRFFSVDPLFREYPWNSTYAFSENRVISAVELEGLEAHDLNGVTVYGPYSSTAEAANAAMAGETEMYVTLPEIEIVEYQLVSLDAQGEDNMGILRSGKGTINDAALEILNSTFIGVLDNSIATFLSDEASSQDKAWAAFDLGAAAATAGKGGRGAGKLRPNKGAGGAHTTFSRGTDGNIFKYETYKKTSSEHFNPQIRYDGGKPDGTPGSPHFNKKTGESIPTPHVQGKNVEGGARAATPDEIPKKN